MHFTAKEILIYVLVILSALFLTAYTVHMVVGGLVRPETEYLLMGGLCAAVAGAIFFMGWDVFRRRRRNNRP